MSSFKFKGTVFTQPGSRNCSRCLNAQMLYCIAILYVNVKYSFVTFNSPSFNQYSTVRLGC